MSVKAMNRTSRLLAASRGLTASQRLVLLALCHRHHSKTGACHPALDTIAEFAGLSVRRVRMALRHLEALGIIETKRRFVNGRQTSNAYLLFPADTAMLLGGQKKPRNAGVRGRTERSDNREGKKDTFAYSRIETSGPGQEEEDRECRYGA